MSDLIQKPSTGIFFALGAALLLSLNDLAIKALADGGYALHQVILIRAFISIAIVLAVIRYAGSGFAQQIGRAHV